MIITIGQLRRRFKNIQMLRKKQLFWTISILEDRTVGGKLMRFLWRRANLIFVYTYLTVFVKFVAGLAPLLRLWVKPFYAVPFIHNRATHIDHLQLQYVSFGLYLNGDFNPKIIAAIAFENRLRKRDQWFGKNLTLNDDVFFLRIYVYIYIYSIASGMSMTSYYLGHYYND